MRAGRIERVVAATVCAAFGVWLALTVPSSPAMGWDESMHVALPAARVVLGARAGEVGAAIQALLDCAQYPPVWPAFLGLIQLPGGIDEAGARAVASLAWAGALGFVFVIARRAARSSGVDLGVAGWAALAFGMSCPLAASFAGTLFLEVPSALATAFALWAWMRRGDATDVQRELLAGFAIALALFTKWNYGLLLGAALALDWALELLVAVRAERARELLLRARWLAAIPLLASVWWFVLPLPGGLDLAREHRAAFAGFLAGNLGGTSATAAERVLYAATGLAPTVRLALLVVVAAFVGLRAVRTPAVRTLALAAGVMLGAPLVHPFFLDRFLIPALVPMFALAGVGLAFGLPRTRLALALTVSSLALVTLVFPSVDGAWLADRLGRLPADEPARGYVREVLEERARIGPRRRLPTGGLERAEHDALLDLVLAEVRPGERVGWLGMSSEMSPAALHLGLLARGRGPEWFLERDPPDLDLTYFGADLAFDDAALRAYAGKFDVILWTDPIDLRERRERAFVAAYCDRLQALRPSVVRELGVVPISRPLRAPLEVRLLACRTAP
jgi:hypothetical protein